jgi:hypothetical protein
MEVGSMYLFFAQSCRNISKIFSNFNSFSVSQFCSLNKISLTDLSCDNKQGAPSERKTGTVKSFDRSSKASGMYFLENEQAEGSKN